MMFVPGVFRCGSSALMLDFAQFGSSTSVRSLGRLGLLVSVMGIA